MKKLVLLLLVTSALAQQSQTAAQPTTPSQPPNFVIKKLAEGVYAAINPDGGRGGSNAGFVVGDDCVLVVDTLVREAPARDFLAEIRKVTNLPIRYVVNTHYHSDHTGGNAVFQETGAAIVAHPNVRKWLHTETLKFLPPNATDEQKQRMLNLAPPSLVYDGDGVEFFLGKRLVIAHFFPGHTGGDTAVFIPDANVVFGGDLMWNHHLPNLIDATTSAWIKTLEMALQHHPSATFVPGHGDVANAADMQAFHDYLVDLRAAIGQARVAGKTGDDLTKMVSDQIKQKYGAWGFLGFLPLNISQTLAEMEGTKKVPQP